MAGALKLWIKADDEFTKRLNDARGFDEIQRRQSIVRRGWFELSRFWSTETGISRAELSACVHEHFLATLCLPADVPVLSCD